MIWQELDIEAMTNLYLYGTLNTPSNKVTEALIRESGKKTTIYIDNVFSFMNDGPGRFAVGANISIVKQFMSGGLFSVPGRYKVGDYFPVPEQRNLTYQQYEYNDLSGDLTQRIYIYNTSGFVLNPDAYFVVKADGTREIENYSILPLDDNFDFESSNGAAKLLNPTLDDWIDPSDIGRRVEIKFSTDAMKKSNTVYTNSNFLNELAIIRDQPVGAGIPSNFLGAGGVMYMEALGMWSDGTTRFVDSQGRAIIYGTDGNDLLSYAKIQSLNILSPMYLNTSESNGIVILGGKGNDKLTGTDYKDRLFGGNDNDILYGVDGDDYMEGGAGFDTYIAGNGDIVKDDVDNQGRVIFDNIDLSGIKYQIKENYEDDDFIYEEQGNTLLVTIKEGGGSITIENWNSTTKEGLGIKLEKAGDIEISVTN
ncbi:MAG: calcium-binding protein, partial [Agitococcus sp.]|nr:calcium-binding protein [Agitococcus sp.]